MIWIDGNIHLILVSAARVGKTSILLRYLNNEFDEHQKSTTNALYNEKQVKTDTCVSYCYDAASDLLFFEDQNETLYGSQLLRCGHRYATSKFGILLDKSGFIRSLLYTIEVPVSMPILLRPNFESE